MASIRPFGQEACPLCMVLMVGGSPVPSTFGHRGEEVPDVLQALLGKWVGWSPWDPVTLVLQRRGRFLSDDEGPVQLALVVSFAGGGAPLLLLGLPVGHLLPSHLLGRRDVGGSSSSAPFRASCGLGLLCGEDVRMECQQRPSWLVVLAPDHVSGDRPGPGRVQQLHADPHLLCISEALVPGVVGAVLPKPWEGIRVALAGAAAAALGACRRRPAGPRRHASSTAGAAFSPLGLKPGGGPPTWPFSSLARAAVLAASPFALAAGVVFCCSRVVARSSGPSSVKMAKASNAPRPGWTEAPHAM
jgi:hypothetical protein